MNKINTSERFVSIPLGVVSLLTLLILLYTHNSWVKLIDNNLAHLDNNSQAQINITKAHLWFEENIHNTSTINIDKHFWQNIEKTQYLLKQLLIGGVNNKGANLVVIPNTKYKHNIEEVILNLTEFKNISQQRLDNRSKNKLSSKLGLHFNTAYNEITLSLSIINNKLLYNFNTGIRNQEIQYYLLSIAWLVIVLLFVFKLQLTSKKKNLLTDGLTQFIDTANAPIFGIDNNGKVN
ncbi:MAG: hypothetical protein QMC62_06150, partial [Alteromonadaceae bacterium]